MQLIFLRTWGDFFVLLIANPMNIAILVIIILIFLFGMSRLNNRLEINSVNRAIALSRGMVGTVMWFVVGPAAAVVVLNIFALIYGVPGIPLGVFFSWLGLTSSSAWWLIRCAFGSESLSGGTEVYSIHGLIRILVVLVPFGFIWIRSTKGKARLFFIPLIVATFLITRYKKAEETFITQDVEIETLRAIPLVGRLFAPPKAESVVEEEKDARGFTPTQRKLIAGILVFFIGTGLLLGLYYKYQAAGLIIVVTGVLGFVLVAPSNTNYFSDLPENEAASHDIDSLIRDMERIYAEQGKCLEVYELSLKLDKAFDVQAQEVPFPDSLCLRYKDYFFNRCTK